MSPILLVDLSAQFWRAYHATKSGQYAYELTLETLTAMVHHYPRMVVCGEGKRPVRHEWFAAYKANRPPKPPEAVESLREIIAAVTDSAVPLLACEGYEADDVIATIATQTTDEVVIWSSDKDLYQLLSDRVHMLIDGKLIGPDECAAKFGVWPEQMRDWLALVGDAADNIPGCPGVGPTRAAQLIQRFGSIDGIRSARPYELGLGPKTLEKFMAWDPALAIKLVTLLYDAPVQVSDFWKTHQQPNQAINKSEETDMADMTKVVTQRKGGPLKILAYGPEGSGKTRFGAFSPKPIFLCAENGLSAPDLREVAAFPAPDSWADVLAAVEFLRTSDHDFKTFVVDSLDWLHKLVKEDVCHANGMTAAKFEDFGRGEKIAFDHWVKLMSALDDLQASRGMHLIALAHSTLKNFPNPQGEDFMRYQLALTDKAADRWKQWPDYLLFMSQELFTKQKESGSKARGVIGEHMFYTTRAAAFDAKNRIGLAPEIPYATENPWRPFAAAVREITAPKKADEPKASEVAA